MYAPDELLEKVKKQVMAEFKDQIISFEWDHEQECTFVYVEIGAIALQIPAINRIHEMVYTIIGHPDSSEYIVPVHVRATERVGAKDGLFNLTYDGAGSNSFFLHYYAPDQDRLIPFNVSIYYKKMFEAIRTIHLDSPAQLWERLVRPSRESAAKRRGVVSFSKELLAEELRDFLLKHLDFIKHIAKVTNKPLQIIEPAPMPTITQSTNAKGEIFFLNVYQDREMVPAIAA